MPDCLRCLTDPFMFFHRCAGWGSPPTNTSNGVGQGGGDAASSTTRRSQAQGYPYIPTHSHGQPGRYMPNQLSHQMPASAPPLNGHNSGPGSMGNLTFPTYVANGQGHYSYASQLSHSIPSTSHAPSFGQNPSFLPPALPGPIVRDVVGTEAMTYASNLRRQTSARFYCPHCPSNFTARHNYHSHLLAHSGQRPFKCNSCNSAFVTLGDLKRHENTKKHAQMLRR
ncbi:hypothetical protein AB1N83_004199 [Pleurotus pulmonarius]